MAENEIILGEGVDLADWPVRGPWRIPTLVRWLKKQEKRVEKNRHRNVTREQSSGTQREEDPRQRTSVTRSKRGWGVWALVDHW